VEIEPTDFSKLQHSSIAKGKLGHLLGGDHKHFHHQTGYKISKYQNIKLSSYQDIKIIIKPQTYQAINLSNYYKAIKHCWGR